MYGAHRCLDLHERPEIAMPRTTYQTLRERYLVDACSRTTIFDYRHTMREVHAVLEYIHQGVATPSELARRIIEAMYRVKMLARCQTLIH